MIRKSFVLALSMLFVVTLSAGSCGEDDTPDDGNEVVTPDPDPDDEPDPTEPGDDPLPGVKELFTVTQTVPVFGNAYITNPGGNIDVGSASGIRNWTASTAVVSVWFHVSKPGTLHLALYGTSAMSSTVGATVNGDLLSATALKSTADTVILGKTELVRVGYVRVDLKGLKRSGVDFGNYSALKIGGTATEGGKVTFVPDDRPAAENWPYWGRRGPSVHCRYDFSGLQVEWFYNEVTVPVGQDVIGSYYMANGFGEGYFGMQANSATERRVLFSVWSPYSTDDPSTIPEEDRVKLIAKGDGVTVNDFGNEGSGGQSYLIFNWEAGKTYRFLNRVRPIADGYSEYTAYFGSPDDGKWRLIAKWKRPKIQTFYTSPYSFLENFVTTNGWISRQVNFDNQWVRTVAGEWREVTKATFTYDNTGRNGIRLDYAGWADGDGFWLRNCGFFDDNTALNAGMTRTASGTVPNVDLDALSKL